MRALTYRFVKGGGISCSYVKTALFALALPFAAGAAVDVYVAKDGDDANDGLTRATAKATIPAGYTAMTNRTDASGSTFGNRLIVGDGEWEWSTTMVLSNGWSLVGENGVAGTTLKVGAAVPLFELTTSDAAVRNVTVDFNNVNFMDVSSGLVLKDSIGEISGCHVKNYKSSWGNSLIRMGTAKRHLVVKGCRFSNCKGLYRSALFWIENATAEFTDCSFLDSTASSGTYWAYGFFYLTNASRVRNCLFLRCSVRGSDGSNNGRGLIVAAAESSGAIVENCSFIDCYDVAAPATYKGGAVGLVAKKTKNGPTARNCLVWNFRSSADEKLAFPLANASHCATEIEDLSGQGHVVLTPENVMWQCAAEDRYIPISGPSLDAAVEESWMAGATDVRGKARINGAGPDIGCYEYHQPNVYYVSKDGDDANDGLTPATAKATVAAGYALLSAEDETLVLGDGVWTTDEIGATLVLSNGWTLAGATEKAVVKKTEADAVPYLLATPGAAAKVTVEEYAGKTYYVAKDGDDANDGLTRATAKATIPAAFAAMTNGPWNVTYANRLVIGEGEWTSADVGATLVLTNGWSLVGENGREKTVLKASVRNFRFFNQVSADTAVRGLTFDFNRSAFYYDTFALSNLKGTLADCELRDYYHNSAIGSSAMIALGSGDVDCSPVITNCIFRNIFNIRNGASVIFGSLTATDVLITDCSFIDCMGGTKDNAGGGNIMFYRSKGTVRNCLFQRARIYGAKSSSYSSCSGVVGCGAVSGNMTVENCTFVDCKIYNHKTAGCVGLSAGNARMTVRNCLAYGNERIVGDVSSPANLITNLMSGATLTFSHCASEFAVPGEGNVALTNTNFRYRAPGRGDYSVLYGPPVNGGQVQPWMTGAKDLCGRDRIIGTSVDIGCFEYDFKSGTTVLVH